MTEPTAAASQVRNPSHEALLGDALGRVLVAAGVTLDVPLTGPQLLLAAEDFIAHQSGVREGDVRLERGELQRWNGQSWRSILPRSEAPCRHYNTHPIGGRTWYCSDCGEEWEPESV